MRASRGGIGAAPPIPLAGRVGMGLLSHWDSLAWREPSPAALCERVGLSRKRPASGRGEASTCPY